MDTCMRFVGYGDDTADRDAWAASWPLRTSPPSLTTVEDAVFVPASTEVDAPRLRGGLLDRDGQPVHAVNLRREGHRVDAGLVSPMDLEVDETLDIEAIDLGWLIGHYGHMLTEGLSRTWALAQFPADMPVLFHQNGNESPRSIVRALLELFGVSADRWVIPQRPTRIRQVHVPESLFELGRDAHEQAACSFHTAAQRVLDREPSVSDQPVYFSRRYITTDRRSVIGEMALEEALRESGAVVVHPERMPLHEQIRLVNQHRHIISPLASAAHTVLFSLCRPHLHLLTQEPDNPTFVMVSRLAQAPTTFVRCITRPAPGFSGGHPPSLLDITVALNYLAHEGLVPRSLVPFYASAHRVRRHEEEFDEAAACGLLRLAIARDSGLPDLPPAAALQWPVQWMLARLHANHQPEMVAHLVTLFLAGAADERDVLRLARWRRDVSQMAGPILRVCSPELAQEARQSLRCVFGLAV